MCFFSQQIDLNLLHTTGRACERPSSCFTNTDLNCSIFSSSCKMVRYSSSRLLCICKMVRSFGGMKCCNSEFFSSTFSRDWRMAAVSACEVGGVVRICSRDAFGS